MQILKVFYCQKKMKNKIQISLIQTNIKKKKKKKKTYSYGYKSLCVDDKFSKPLK